jgi:hypothetical protein
LTQPRKVVLGPDLFVAALFDPRARETLQLWRDGAILPIVTRELLVLYLRTLRQAGLDQDLIRKWSLWLTASHKTIYLENLPPTQTTGLPLCREIAAATHAELLTTRTDAPPRSVSTL